MVTIAICEDNLDTAKRIKDLVEAFGAGHPGAISRVSVFSSAATLLEYVEQKGGFSVYLLDIMMPGITGIEAAEQLRASDNNAAIVFLTSSVDFALDAFRVGAMQYLIKPVKEEELFAVLEQAEKLVSQSSSKSILVSTVRGRENLHFSCIVYVECRNHILTYHLSDGSHLPGRTIRTSFEVAMEPLLKERNFIHPHKSFIINADFVERLTPHGFVMRGGAEIPITKSRYSHSRARYLQYFDLTKNG